MHPFSFSSANCMNSHFGKMPSLHLHKPSKFTFWGTGNEPHDLVAIGKNQPIGFLSTTMSLFFKPEPNLVFLVKTKLALFWLPSMVWAQLWGQSFSRWDTGELKLSLVKERRNLWPQAFEPWLRLFRINSEQFKLINGSYQLILFRIKCRGTFMR